MKQSFVILAGIAALASAGPIGAILGAVMGKGKRDLEFADALLVVRDRTIQEWDQVVYNPSLISREMLAALKQRGYTPPAQVKGTYTPAPGSKPQSQNAISKSYALLSVIDGHKIPPTVLQHMKTAGWTGPGLDKREEEEEFTGLKARGYDDDYLELFARDFDDEYDY